MSYCDASALNSGVVTLKAHLFVLAGSSEWAELWRLRDHSDGHVHKSRPVPEPRKQSSVGKHQASRSRDPSVTLQQREVAAPQWLDVLDHIHWSTSTDDPGSLCWCTNLYSVIYSEFWGVRMRKNWRSFLYILVFFFFFFRVGGQVGGSCFEEENKRVKCKHSFWRLFYVFIWTDRQ